MTAACLLVRSPACSARQLQTSIVQVVHLCPTGFRKEPCERLERHKPKGLRVVLRGLGSSNAPRLPGGGGGDVTSLPDPQGSNPLGPPGPELLPAGTDSRRTGAAWAGLCGIGHGMDFGVGALILMGVIMIGPPTSEKGPRHPTAVTPRRQ